jgi:hypothetical protein
MRKTAPPPAARRTTSAMAPVERELPIGFLTAAGIYFGLAFVFFFPAFLPGQHIFGTDYIGGAYVFYDFISDRIAAGTLPKWVPYVFGGLPLFANPGSTFQPVHFLTDLLLPTDRVLPAVFVVQFWLAGIGMYLLCRELGCRMWIAFVAGIAFQFTGIIISWVYAGHDGRIIVATLAPLFFYFLHMGARTVRIAPFGGAAATLGAALLSFQIQNSYYLLLAAGIWGIFCLFQLDAVRRPAVLARVVPLAFGSVALGFLLAAVNFLPFLSYVPESPRGMEGGRGYEYAISFSMPPAEVLSLAVPEHHGVSVSDPATGQPLFPSYRGGNPFKLHTEYVGAFVIVMLVLGVAYARRDRYWWFFAGLGLFMLTIALGGHTPLYRIYFEVLPGTQRFRAPSLSFFIVALSLVAMAALTLERIARLRSAAAERWTVRTEPEPGLSRLPWIAASVAVIAVLGAMATAGGSPDPSGISVSVGWARFALFSGLVAGALWLWIRGTTSTSMIAVVLAIVTFADLWIVGRRFFHLVDPPEVIFASDDVVGFLRVQPRPARVWTFPYPQYYRGAGTYGGNYPMLFGVEQVGGEHPNMLQRWVEYVGAGTQTYIDWHNLITEAQVVSTADGQAIGFQSRPGFLEAANVRYIISMAPLAHPALREVHRGSALVYEHLGALPRAYLVPELVHVDEEGALAAMQAAEWDPRRTAFVPAAANVQLPGGPLEGQAHVLVHDPDRVVVQASASRPAMMVLADNFYEGWRAQIDGQPADLMRVNHTFRGVVVPAGESTVEIVFRPPSLYTGLYLTIAGFLLLIGIGGYALLGLRRRSEGKAEAV